MTDNTFWDGFGFSSHGTIDWFSISDLESAVIQSLPHGSGINADWTVNRLKNGKIQAFNSFHVMSEHGFYIGWADFSVTFDPSLPLPELAQTFRLQFHGSQAQYLNTYYGLREYLDDTLFYCIDNAEERIE